MIISGFPGTGKSYVFNNINNVKITDSDSSQFSWVKDDNGNNTKERNPDFPRNYIEHIKDCVDSGYALIFVSSHKEVRDALDKEGLKYNIVIPCVEDKDEYIRRYKERGSPDSFIKLINENFENWILQIKNEYIDRSEYVVELNSGETMLDFVKPYILHV